MAIISPNKNWVQGCVRYYIWECALPAHTHVQQKLDNGQNLFSPVIRLHKTCKDKSWSAFFTTTRRLLSQRHFTKYVHVKCLPIYMYRKPTKSRLHQLFSSGEKRNMYTYSLNNNEGFLFVYPPFFRKDSAQPVEDVPVEYQRKNR